MTVFNKFLFIVIIISITIIASENNSLAKTELDLCISKIQDEFDHVRGSATFTFDLDEKGYASNVKILKADISPSYEINEILRYIDNMKFNFLISQTNSIKITVNFAGSRNLKSADKVAKPIIIVLLIVGANVFTVIFLASILNQR